MKDAQSCQILQSHGLHSPRNSPGQNTGVLAFPFSRGPSQARDWTQVSRTADGFFTSWATREAQDQLITNIQTFYYSRSIISFLCFPFFSIKVSPKPSVGGVLLTTSSFSSVAQPCLTLCNPVTAAHARLPCPSPTTGACSNTCPSSRWCQFGAAQFNSNLFLLK